MLKENIKQLRKAKGLSQEELAVRLGVVRQTISKWEQGLSVPDSDLLIKLAEVLDTRVSILLGENIKSDVEQDTIRHMADKLEILNQEYARSKETRRKIWRILSIGLGIFCGIALVEILYVYGSILFAVLEPNSSVVGVIGGADGPTAIFVTSQLTGLLMHARVILPPVIGFLAAIWGIRKTRRY